MTSFGDTFAKWRKRIFDPPMYWITYNDVGLELRFFFFFLYFRRWWLGWDDIASIHGEKLDKWTYEENFLNFERRDGKWFSVGELDKGFDSFESEIFRRFPDIRKGWMAELEINPAGVRFLLSPRMKAVDPDLRTLARRRARIRRRASR